MKRTLFCTVLAALALAACVDSNRDNNGGGEIHDEGSKIAFTERAVPVNRDNLLGHTGRSPYEAQWIANGIDQTLDDGRILQLLVAVAPFNARQLTIRNLDILHVIKAERAWKREKCRFRPRIPQSIC